MPDIVYLIKDEHALRFSPDVANEFIEGRLPFSELASQLEKAVSRQYKIDLKVGHVILDVKFPLVRESVVNSRGSIFGREIKRRIPDNDPDCNSFPKSGDIWSLDMSTLIKSYEIERYRTIILNEGATMGNLMGYSLRGDRAANLAKMVRIYTGRGEYASSGRFSPPYFALTTESTDELGSAFEAAGLEVRLVKSQSKIIAVEHPQLKAKKKKKHKHATLQITPAEITPERAELYNQLFYILGANLRNRAAQESWPYSMALRYKMSLGQDTTHEIKFKTLLEMFQDYEDAQKAGRRLSYKEIGRKRGLTSGSVTRVFRRVGIEPLYGSKPTKKVNPAIVVQLYELGLSTSDVVFFLDDMIKEQVRQILDAAGTPRHSNPLVFRIKFSPLNCRLASQIYEARDLGYDTGEIAQLLDTRENVVDFAIARRADIGSKIIQALRIVYNDNRYYKPYKTSIKN